MALTATLSALKDTELDKAHSTTNCGTYGYLAQSEYPDKKAAALAPKRTRKQRLTGFQNVTIQGRRTFHLNRRIW